MKKGVRKTNQIIINIGDEDPREYMNEIKAAIPGALKKLFQNDVEFRGDETTPMYYPLDLMEKIQVMELG